MISIPFDPDQGPDQELSFQTPNADAVVLRLAWNPRTSFWGMDIAYRPKLATALSTVTGLKVVPNWPILSALKASFPFDGDFMLLPVAAEAYSKMPMQFEDLGTAWSLCWLTADEVESWRSMNGLG